MHSVALRSIHKGMRTHYDLTSEIRRIFSVTPGFIVTFKVIGSFTDSQNIRRNVVNQHSISKFQKSVDRTISEVAEQLEIRSSLYPLKAVTEGSKSVITFTV